MTIHILVEGPSEKSFFDRWLPKLKLGQFFSIHPHQGKGRIPARIDSPPDRRMRGLLDQLPAKLRGFSTTLDPRTDSVLILVDADDDDPLTLESKIFSVVKECAPQLRLQICIATEETEAFYMGDLKALRNAYPDADMAIARAYVPDSVCGTWELFGQIIGDDGGNKVTWAETISPHLTIQPRATRSPSFRKLISATRALAVTRASTAKKKRYSHRSKNRR